MYWFKLASNRGGTETGTEFHRQAESQHWCHNQGRDRKRAEEEGEGMMVVITRRCWEASSAEEQKTMELSLPSAGLCPPAVMDHWPRWYLAFTCISGDASRVISYISLHLASRRLNWPLVMGSYFPALHANKGQCTGNISPCAFWHFQMLRQSQLVRFKNQLNEYE